MIVNPMFREKFRKDFDDVLAYLNDYSFNTNKEEMRTELSKFHKCFCVIMVWHNQNIKLNENNSYNSMVSNYISIFFQILNKDIKVINYLERNIIENFIKFLYVYIYNQKLGKKNDEIFNWLFEKVKGNDIIHLNLQKIKDIYSTSSVIVHSGNIKKNAYNCLKDYAKYYTIKELSQKNDEIRKITKCINNILFYYNCNVFEKFNVDDKLFIKSFFDKKDLKMFSDKKII